MLVNCGDATLLIHLKIVSNTRLFSFAEKSLQQRIDFQIPGVQTHAHADEGVAKEVKIWADAGQVSEHTESRVYASNMVVLLGDNNSEEVELGKIDLLIRVFNSRIHLQPKLHS